MFHLRGTEFRTITQSAMSNSLALSSGLKEGLREAEVNHQHLQGPPGQLVEGLLADMVIATDLALNSLFTMILVQ